MCIMLSGVHHKFVLQNIPWENSYTLSVQKHFIHFCYTQTVSIKEYFHFWFIEGNSFFFLTFSSRCIVIVLYSFNHLYLSSYLSTPKVCRKTISSHLSPFLFTTSISFSVLLFAEAKWLVFGWFCRIVKGIRLNVLNTMKAMLVLHSCHR